MWAWPRAGLPSRRRRAVPSRPATGNATMNSGIHGRCQAASSRLPRLSARMRSLRDSPEPFSITSPVLSMPAAASVALAARAPAATMSSALSGCALTWPRVASNWRAITLLDHLFMSRTTSASGADSSLKSSRAVPDARPSRTVPPRCPPTSCHSALTSAMLNSVGGSGAALHVRGPQAAGRLPLSTRRGPLSMLACRSRYQVPQGASEVRMRLSMTRPASGGSAASATASFTVLPGCRPSSKVL